jgi:hypothetical protein
MSTWGLVRWGIGIGTALVFVVFLVVLLGEGDKEPVAEQETSEGGVWGFAKWVGGALVLAGGIVAGIKYFGRPGGAVLKAGVSSRPVLDVDSCVHGFKTWLFRQGVIGGVRRGSQVVFNDAEFVPRGWVRYCKENFWKLSLFFILPKAEPHWRGTHWVDIDMDDYKKILCGNFDLRYRRWPMFALKHDFHKHPQRADISAQERFQEGIVSALSHVSPEQAGLYSIRRMLQDQEARGEEQEKRVEALEEGRGEEGSAVPVVAGGGRVG